jgi:AraC family transcriptional regulator of adaptative response/methylated-DNA-[protein]-cysteine methyltransferase
MTTHIDEHRWAAVRDRRPDPRFVFAVRTTRVACRPGCPARTPAPRNVEFFDDFPAAARAGYRACKRCAPDDVAADADRARLVARACALLGAAEPAALAEVAAAVGLSRFHFQRVFRAVTGVTPGAYLRARRDERFRARLAGGASVTSAVHDAGYGSSGRAYAAGALGMTPSAFRAGARGERIAFACAPCSLGCVLVATTARGICAIELGDDEAGAQAALARHFPHAERTRDDVALRSTLRDVVALVDDPANASAAARTLELDVRGTAFQRKVWDALREIRPGAPVSYKELARAVGSPGAAQAVGAACGANRLAVAIPCHRVVREDGDLAGYRWGLERKRALLARERA